MLRPARAFAFIALSISVAGSGLPAWAEAPRQQPQSPGKGATLPPTVNQTMLDAAKTRFEVGTELFRRARYNEAIVELEAARQYLDPPDLDYDLGLCYEKIERFDEAIASYKRNLAKAPVGPRAHEVQGRIRTMEARKHTIASMERAVDELSTLPRKRLGIGFGASVGYRQNGGAPEGTLFPHGGTFAGELVLDIVLTPRLSLELWLPLVNMIVVPAASDSALVWAQLLAKVYVKGGSKGFFVAPGVGTMITGPKDRFPTTATVELPLALGYEFDFGKLGLVLGVRPWLDIDVYHPSVGFGVVAQIELMGYVRTGGRREPSAPIKGR